MARKLAVNDGRPLIPEELITGQPYWKKLSRDDQTVVMEQTQKIGRLGWDMKRSHLEMGESLLVLQQHLKEYFRPHLKNLNLKEKTAYRIMENYRETKKMIPVQAMPTLMAMNYDFAQKKYLNIIKKIGPPSSSEPAVVEAWAEDVVKAQKEKFRANRTQGEVLPPEVPRDPEDMLEESFRYAKIRFHRLPNSKNRMKWIERLFGYLLKEAGVGSPMSFSPMTAPESFLTGRGRPKLDS